MIRLVLAAHRKETAPKDRDACRYPSVPARAGPAIRPASWAPRWGQHRRTDERRPRRKS